jgi:hypothetical protein
MIDVNNIFVSKYDEVILQCTSKIDATNKLQRIQDALNLMDKLEKCINTALTQDNADSGFRVYQSIVTMESYNPNNK